MATARPDESEAEFQGAVLDLATLFGWTYYHTHDSRRSTEGFPDLVLARERIIYVELKKAKGTLSPEQVAWQRILKKAGGEVYVWRPRDFAELHAVLKKKPAPSSAPTKPPEGAGPRSPETGD